MLPLHTLLFIVVLCRCMTMSAVGISTREIEDIYKIISGNSHLDSAAIDGLERYVDRIPELHDVVAFYRTGDELRSLQPFARTYEVMIRLLRKNGDESSRVCRQMYSDLYVYEMMRFNNKESQRLWEEAERLAYEYDSDSLSRSMFLLAGAGSPAPPDFDAKRRACSLVDSIDVYPLRQNSIDQIIMVCLITGDNVTARQMARRNVEKAEEDSRDEREGNFNIVSMHSRLRNISCLKETGAPSQAREKAVELLEYYKKYEAPPSVMLYLYGFVDS